ncbi:MAG TPA: hypothetical protein VFX85_02055 [Solirubrobacterales bacterium]|nr:hypothetical protein [Solirubrobacterales bacterium]
MRNIKTLGLALMAVLSMGAVMAVAAQADTLTAQAYPAVLTGTAEPGFTDEFKTTAGVAKCPDTKYDATITGPINTAGKVLVTPTYPHVGCTYAGFPATIDHKSCTFEFKVLALTGGTVNLECVTPGDEITITALSAGVAKCTAHVKPQTDVPGLIKYSNISGEVTVEVSLTEIHYTHTQGTGLGSCPSGTANNGTLVAKATVSAETHAGTSTSLILSN